MGLKKHNPGCNCCGCTLLTCVRCEDNEASCSYEVIISGVSNDTCSDCGDLNGTYVFDETEYDPNVNGTICRFLKEIPDTCGFLYMRLIFYGDGTIIPYTVQVDFADAIGAVAKQIVWLETFASRPDCDTLNALDLPYNTRAGTDCDAASSTCTVTAL